MPPQILKTGSSILTACVLLGGIGPIQGQETGSDDLKIVIISGEGFTNNIKRRTARDEVVEVRDRNNKPVAGATVSFLLPNSGAGGTFANGAQAVQVTTNQAGRAVALVKPNTVAGPFKVNVTASFQGHTATAAISQTNTAAAVGVSGTAIGIGVGVAAAAAATTVAVVKLLGGGSKTAKIKIGQPQIP